MSSYRFGQILTNLAAYIVLTAFAFVMLFPFLFMFATSLKTPDDTYNYPPRLFPREQKTMIMSGLKDPAPMYFINVNGKKTAYALVQTGISAGVFADPKDTTKTFPYPLELAVDTGKTISVNNETIPLFEVSKNGEKLELAKVGQTAVGKFIDPENDSNFAFQVVRTSEPVTKITWHPENYSNVLNLENMGRSLTNTMLITIFVVIGQIVTSVMGGYAFARLRFPGRDKLFVFYLGTIMIPFVMLIIPLYQLMVLFGWTDRFASLIFPWIFTAYGTFLMRQFFITVPKEIEEAALIDGASRMEILRKIFLPAAAPALATLATFTFLYAWNSFFWPLVIINTGNYDNHVLTLTLNMLRGRASNSANLILAGAAISIIPPMILFILGQRFFIESAMSSGVKG